MNILSEEVKGSLQYVLIRQLLAVAVLILDDLFSHFVDVINDFRAYSEDAAELGNK